MPFGVKIGRCCCYTVEFCLKLPPFLWRNWISTSSKPLVISRLFPWGWQILIWAVLTSQSFGSAISRWIPLQWMLELSDFLTCFCKISALGQNPFDVEKSRGLVVSADTVFKWVLWILVAGTKGWMPCSNYPAQAIMVFVLVPLRLHYLAVGCWWSAIWLCPDCWWSSGPQN